jgi:hypothetical protein
MGLRAGIGRVEALVRYGAMYGAVRCEPKEMALAQYTLFRYRFEEYETALGSRSSDFRGAGWPPPTAGGFASLVCMAGKD